jgi:Tol biopolymer transport system component
MSKRTSFLLCVALLSPPILSVKAPCQQRNQPDWQVAKLAFDLPNDHLSPITHIDIFMVKLAPGPASEMYVVDAPGSRPRKLAPGSHPVWSPDGSRLTFCTEGDSASKKDRWSGQIAVINADGSGRKVLTAVDGGACFPDWSPDGKQIAFTGFGGKEAEIYVMDADGENVAAITAGYAPRWSPDGKVLLFLRPARYPDLDIWMASADGKTTRKVVEADFTTQSPTCVPGHRGIAFSAKNSEGAQVIFRSRLDGNQPEQMTGERWFGGNASPLFGGYWFEPNVAPDGVHFVAVACIAPVIGEGAHLVLGPRRQKDFFILWRDAEGCSLQREYGSQTPILLVDAETHEQSELARGIHPSVLWVQK